MTAQDDFDYWMAGGVFEDVAGRAGAVWDGYCDAWAEATCAPGSWSEGFMEDVSDAAFAPFGYAAFAATEAEHAVYGAADYVGEWFDGVDWTRPDRTPHVQPAYRWG